MKTKTNNKSPKQSLFLKISLVVLALTSIEVNALAPPPLPAGRIGGEAYMTYDRAAWATMMPEYTRTDIHGTPIEGALGATSDTDGNRFLYPQLFLDHNSPTAIKQSNLASEEKIANGTADPEAVAQWRIPDLAQRVPLAQPTGGFAMQVDDLRAGVPWPEKSGWIPSTYNPYPGEEIPLQIGLGGSLRLSSDFIAPGASLWFASMDLREQVAQVGNDWGYKWYTSESFFLRQDFERVSSRN